MGSGSCGVSAKETGRSFIGVEREKEYFEISGRRIAEAAEGVVNPDIKQLTTQMLDVSQKSSGKLPL
jgi:DNA modification methylase